MAQFGPNMALFWTNMALNVPGNSHEVKIGLMPMKYIQTDHLDPVLSLSGPYSGSLRSFYDPIWTKMALFWTNMALKVPGNSHEVKIGLILMKYIQADHLGPVLSLSGAYSGSLRSFYGPIWTKMALPSPEWPWRSLVTPMR